MHEYIRFPGAECGPRTRANRAEHLGEINPEFEPVVPHHTGDNRLNAAGAIPDPACGIVKAVAG
jgi:hypothetical protein